LDGIASDGQLERDTQLSHYFVQGISADPDHSQGRNILRRARNPAVLPSAEVGQDGDAERSFGARSLNRLISLWNRPKISRIRHGVVSLFGGAEPYSLMKNLHVN